MDTEKCHALIHVVETGNIRRSAEDLGYTPSGISRMLASLERELGVTLLVRSKRGVTPTTACKELLPQIRKVAEAGKSCTEAAQALVGIETGQVHVGIAYPQFYGKLADVLSGFRKLHPGIQIMLREGNSTPLARLLESGDLDFAIMSRRPGTFRWKQLLEDRLVALVPADHPLAHAESYPIERFAEDPYVEIGPGEDTDNATAFAEHRVEPNTCCAVSLDSAGYELVSAGLGVALTNEIHAKSHNDAGRVVALPTNPEVTLAIGIAFARDELASPAARAFIAYALGILARD